VSSSYALTASHVNPLNQNVIISGSLTVTSSIRATFDSTFNGANGALRALSATNTAKRVDIGYDNTINGGYINVQEAGVDWRPLFINPISTISSPVVIGVTINDGINKLQVSGSGRFIGNVTASNGLINSALSVRQSITASTALISGSGTQRLVVVGSGSTQPIVTVLGSQGELFSITDSLSGSLFSVNDISGLPILEVFSDSTILMGNYLAPSLNTTFRTGSIPAGVNTIYSFPTTSYDAVFLDYSIKSGSNARAGHFTATWLGITSSFMDNSTLDIGNTTGFVFGAKVIGANLVVTGSATTAGWTVKTIIRSI
jgi:hypothetical protein